MRVLLTPLLMLAVFIPLRLPTSLQPTGANRARTHTGFTPLTDLHSHRYKGFQGGLYEHGSNTPPLLIPSWASSTPNSSNREVPLVNPIPTAGSPCSPSACRTPV